MNDAQHPLNALPQGHRLQEYELVRVLGFGGFGMTYLGFDHNLDKAVAIKEYLPSDIATRTDDDSVAPQASQFRDDFEWGLDRFLDEARTLARFDHRHIIKVFRFFEAHGTAYIVMEYAEGETLSDFLKRKWTLKEAELKAILYPILEGLEVVHGADFLHRDIKPANIIIRDEDDLPVLLDFGAARQAIGTKSRSITSIITPGYAPIEQYERSGHQGPWTDIYALGAVCYHALTGQVPNDATERMRRDSLLPVSERCAGQASNEFLSAIDWALQVNEEDRPQSIADWRSALETSSNVDIPSRETPPPPPPEGQDRDEEDAPSAPPKKHRGKLFATLACLLVVLTGGISYYQYEAQQRRAQETTEVEVSQERAAKVLALLSGAEKDLSRDRLTSPAGDNAWEKYQEVLKLEPGHKIASAGLDSIINRYVSKFEASLNRKAFSDAEGYMSRIQSVYADAPVLSELADRLSGAREAERDRQSKIARYEGEFEEALGKRDFAMADRYVDSLRAVNADESMLSELAERLSAAREEQRRQEEQRVGRRFKDCNECPEMVVVPSGSFTMGSPNGEEGREDDEGPRHRVNIAYPFAVGVYEVTFFEWDACVSDGGCNGYRPGDEGWGRGNRPVINVNWGDAQSYVVWLSEKTGHEYRLLSESEWEYVARSGTTTPFYFGSTISTDQANYNGNYTYGTGRKGEFRGKTVSVGSFRANGWGIYDMHGNVWEWVQDCYNNSYVGAPIDGSAWESGNCGMRVLRGGSWVDGPRNLRSAIRYWITSENLNDFNGFRVLRQF